MIYRLHTCPKTYVFDACSSNFFPICGHRAPTPDGARSLVDDVEFSPEDAGRSDPDFLCQVRLHTEPYVREHVKTVSKKKPGCKYEYRAIILAISDLQANLIGKTPNTKWARDEGDRKGGCRTRDSLW